MKKLLFILIVLANTAVGQYNPDAKRDYKWYFGYGDTLTLGKTYLDFNNSTPTFDTISMDLNFFMANTGMCDIYGDLLFYTNSSKVVNANLELMPSGDSMGYGLWYNFFMQSPFQWGAGPTKGVVSFQVPASPNKFILIYERCTDTILLEVTPLYMEYSVVDMDLDNGLGDLIQKNTLFFTDTLDLRGIGACRHGNGRDWWIIVRKAHYECYHIFLLEPTGIQHKTTQCFSETRDPYLRAGSSVFSPNGEFYATTAALFPDSSSFAEVYSFDRCNGVLNKITSFNVSNTGGWGGVSISPDSQFLYYSRGRKIYQYNLETPDIKASEQLVAVCDLMPSTLGGGQSGFADMQLGPDGKIYIGQFANFLAVINHPDLPGMDCDVQQHALIFPRMLQTELPYFPNFRLGRAIGSECDTLVWSGITKPEIPALAQLVARPNPASGNMRFELNTYTFDKEGSLEIYTLSGAMIRSIAVARYQGIVPFDASGLPDGMYLAVFKQEGGVLGTVRFVVSR